MTEEVEIVEVGPRDGFQAITAPIPTESKIAIIRGLHEAGLRRIEATSFVSPSAVPQLADAAEIVEAARALDGLDIQVLAPTARQAERALAAGVRHLCFVISVSEAHNRSNVRRTPLESAEEYAALVRGLPDNVRVRLNLATAFDCPFLGRVDESATFALLERLLAVKPDVEVAFCDTTGRVSPRHVSALFQRAQQDHTDVRAWAFHGHDTYGLGAANALAAWTVGVRVFDASVAGLGGCPFAPGATGNVATEDLVWMFESMAVATHVDLNRLRQVAETVERLPQAQTGGRVREALRAADLVRAR